MDDVHDLRLFMEILVTSAYSACGTALVWNVKAHLSNRMTVSFDVSETALGPISPSPSDRFAPNFGRSATSSLIPEAAVRHVRQLARMKAASGTLMPVPLPAVRGSFRKERTSSRLMRSPDVRAGSIALNRDGHSGATLGSRRKFVIVERAMYRCISTPVLQENGDADQLGTRAWCGSTAGHCST